jgi:hypothetical protein
MLRISILEGRNERRLIVEGKLVAPWSAELKTACDRARVDLGGRELVIDVRNLSVISQEGETVLLDLMNQGVRFRCCGVFTKQVLKQLARRTRRTSQEMKP